MTEVEWLTCTEPTAMLRFLRRGADERKLRLFACACCRRAWPQLTDERCRQAVEVAERYANGLATDRELEAAQNLDPDVDEDFAYVAGLVADESAFDAAFYGSDNAAGLVAATAAKFSDAYGAEHRAQSGLLVDVVGNPFRPVTVDRRWLAWNSGAVEKVAQAVYDDRQLPSGHLDAVRLAVLADMLEEAGCADPDILSHLRGPGPHVRGCWVVDALVGKF